MIAHDLAACYWQPFLISVKLCLAGRCNIDDICLCTKLTFV
ncbi:MAG: hypothetical protein JWR09_5686 [Mucilaginibacter sp.]|nr:hypothetical protein [Mucilaginibacter sp.]